MQVKKQHLEPDIEQWTGLKLEKEYVKAVYCHSAYLIYMQCTSCKIRDWREVGGGIGMGNICKSMADSYQCMTKPTAML